VTRPAVSVLTTIWNRAPLLQGPYERLRRHARRTRYGRHRLPRGTLAFWLLAFLLRCTGRVRRIEVCYGEAPDPPFPRKRGFRL